MKKTTLNLVFLFLISATDVFAQTKMKELKVGHPFTVSIPEYMIKTAELNSSASVQFKNEVKEVYGIVIEDLKEELVLAELNYAGITEFFEGAKEDFTEDENVVEASEPVVTTKGGINFIESDIVLKDKESETEIYYMYGIVETKLSYYKVLCWTSAKDKNKYKPDFQKILYSLKD